MRVTGARLKYLKVSLGLEATEALDLTKWKSDEDVEAALNEADFRARMAEECADVPCSGRSSTPGTPSPEIIDKQLTSFTLRP
jgi:hypothetical protein